jgi:hypothetical protein
LKLAKQWISSDGLITLLLTVDHQPPNWATFPPLEAEENIGAIFFASSAQPESKRPSLG